MRGEAFVFLTHVVAGSVLGEYRKICRGSRSLGTPFLLHMTDEPVAHVGGIENYFAVTPDDLGRLGYPGPATPIVPGRTHFPLLHFSTLFNSFDHYWLIEYDVRFFGRWGALFQYFHGATPDLLTCHIRPFALEPKWNWWRLEHPREQIPPGRRLRAFHPIYRISRRAVEHVDRMHREGWSGHYEVLLPTLLVHAGFEVRDFGGDGPFVSTENRNRFYIDAPDNEHGHLNDGTMRWRPEHARPGWRLNKLYHPVKS